MDKHRLTDIERLHHISEAIALIFSFIEEKDETDFIEDQMLNSSVLYQFIIIGEAVRFLDTELLSKYPYPWHLPKSFRNYLTHEYFGINLGQVFKTVKFLLPEFKVLIDKMIEKESNM